MSFIVKGAHAPKNCSEWTEDLPCPFLDTEMPGRGTNEFDYICTAAEDRVIRNIDRRQNFCPCVQLHKNHGHLIDRSDVLRNVARVAHELDKNRDAYTDSDIASMFTHSILDAPIIFEREDED